MFKKIKQLEVIKSFVLYAYLLVNSIYIKQHNLNEKLNDGLHFYNSEMFILPFLVEESFH